MRRASLATAVLLTAAFGRAGPAGAALDGGAAGAAETGAPQEATMPDDTARSIGGVRFEDSLAEGDGPRGEELDALTARVAAQLRCPVCRNQSVVESSATLSQQMQAEIRRRLAAGESPREVKQYFVSRYGEWILLQPRAEGINLLVYILPALAVLGGLALVWIRIRQWTDGDAAGAVAGAGDRATPTTARPPSEEPVGAAAPPGGAPGNDGGGAPSSRETAGAGEGARPDGELSDEERRRLDELIREGS